MLTQELAFLCVTSASAVCKACQIAGAIIVATFAAAIPISFPEHTAVTERLAILPMATNTELGCQVRVRASTEWERAHSDERRKVQICIYVFMYMDGGVGIGFRSPTTKPFIPLAPGCPLENLFCDKPSTGQTSARSTFKTMCPSSSGSFLRFLVDSYMQIQRNSKSRRTYRSSGLERFKVAVEDLVVFQRLPRSLRGGPRRKTTPVGILPWKGNVETLF